DRDPVDGQAGPLVELAHESFVPCGDEGEHDLVDPHEDRAGVLHRRPFGPHRPRGGIEPSEDGPERREVDAGPVALDEERRERVWYGRLVHGRTVGPATLRTEGAITPISRGCG